MVISVDEVVFGSSSGNVAVSYPEGRITRGTGKLDQMAHTDKLVADSVGAVHGRPGRMVAETVLVAVDFSEKSEAALLWACDYAAQTGARLEVLHVIHDPAESPGKYHPNNGDLLQPMADTAEEMMAEFMDRMRETHAELKAFENVPTLLRAGLPVSMILDVAENRAADLVVMGSQGQNALQRLLLGSTVQQVVQRSRTPVTVVRARNRV